MWEHVYVALSAIFCLFLVATMIGDVAGLLTRLDASATALAHKLNRFDEYARRHGLPDRLQRRVHQYWAHRHSQQRGVDEEELLADMPSTLRTDIAAARYLRFLRPLPYFSFCEPNLLRQLCEALKVEIFCPGDVVLLEEDLGRQLLIVKETGFVAVVKRGVRGPNQAKYVRKLAQRGGQIGGARVPGDQARRASPALSLHVCSAHYSPLQQARPNRRRQGHQQHESEARERRAVRKIQDHLRGSVREGGGCGCTELLL